MPLEAQAKLLRVLQTREVWPLGATAPERVDVRVICATHRDLLALQRQGQFREDLYARLNDYHLRLPPLRERKEDMLMLARAFLERHGRRDLTISFPYILALLSYDWPYNIRELESCIKRSIALTGSESLGEGELPDTIRAAMVDYGRPWNELPAVPTQGEVQNVAPNRVGATPRTGTQTPSEEQLRQLLGTHHGNVAAVGRQLGKARMQIHRWLKRYGIRPEDFR